MLISIPSVFAEGPDVYDVAISLIGIGEINKQVGSYELDFWYSIFSEEKDLMSMIPLNTLPTNLDTLSDEEDDDD